MEKFLRKTQILGQRKGISLKICIFIPKRGEELPVITFLPSSKLILVNVISLGVSQQKIMPCQIPRPHFMAIERPWRVCKAELIIAVPEIYDNSWLVYRDPVFHLKSYFFFSKISEYLIFF
jgi:hypothetical protein